MNTLFLSQREKNLYQKFDRDRVIARTAIEEHRCAPPGQRDVDTFKRVMAEMNECISKLNHLEQLNTEREYKDFLAGPMAGKVLTDWWMVGLDEEVMPYFMAPGYVRDDEADIALYVAAVGEFRAKHPIPDQDVVILDPRRYAVFREYVVVREDAAFECRIYGRRLRRIDDVYDGPVD